MNFEMIFSGPCAYVPNRLATDSNPAPSWSVILPQIRLGRRVGEVQLEPHYAVLQFPLDQFVTESVDLRFQRQGLPEYGLIFLSGHKVRIEVPDPQPFCPALFELSPQVLESGRPETPAEIESLEWLPSLQRLARGAGVFGDADQLFFLRSESFSESSRVEFFTEAIPQEGNIAAHVVLDHGRLVTHSLVPDVNPATNDRNIWEFRAALDQPILAKQAVAYKVALKLNLMQGPLSIHLIKEGEQRTVRLRENIAQDRVTVELKNREMDEVLQLAEDEAEVGGVDRDFKILYSLSGLHQGACPLPVLSDSGGLGTRRTTCGGARFIGFSGSF